MGLVFLVNFAGGGGALAGGDGGGGDAAIEEGGAVGGAAVLVAGGVRALAPGVVGELVEELEGGAVGLEAVGALGEAAGLTADFAVEAGVADAAVEPIVDTVVEVAGLGVGVADAPAGDNFLADVSFVVAVGVFEEEEARGLGDDDAAVGER